MRGLDHGFFDRNLGAADPPRRAVARSGTQRDRPVVRWLRGL